MSVKIIQLMMFLILTQILGESMYHHYSEAWHDFSKEYPKTVYALNTAADLTSYGAELALEAAIYGAKNTARVVCTGTAAGISAGAKEALKVGQEASFTLWSSFSANYPKTASVISTAASWAHWGAGIAWSAAQIGASWSSWGAKTAWDSLDGFMQSY